MDDHMTSWHGSVDVRTAERTTTWPARARRNEGPSRRQATPPPEERDEPDLDSLIRAQRHAAHRDLFAAVAVVLGILAVLVAVLVAVL